MHQVVGFATFFEVKHLRRSTISRQLHAYETTKANNVPYVLRLKHEDAYEFISRLIT